MARALPYYILLSLCFFLPGRSTLLGLLVFTFSYKRLYSCCFGEKVNVTLAGLVNHFLVQCGEVKARFLISASLLWSFMVESRMASITFLGTYTAAEDETNHSSHTDESGFPSGTEKVLLDVISLYLDIFSVEISGHIFLSFCIFNETWREKLKCY